MSEEKVFTNQEKSLLLIQEWQMHWMHQQQNDTSDFKNYFNRAMGVDSNMRHHLARKIRDVLDAKDGQIEYLNLVVKERESWAARQLETIKKLEKENDKLTGQIARGQGGGTGAKVMTHG